MVRVLQLLEVGYLSVLRKKYQILPKIRVGYLSVRASEKIPNLAKNKVGLSFGVGESAEVLR